MKHDIDVALERFIFVQKLIVSYCYYYSQN